jgi:hypothetical protein
LIDLIVSAIRCPQIKTPTQLVVALAIARRCGDENGRCFAKQSTLAEDTRLHPKTVAKTLAEFEAMDPPLIRRVKHPAFDDGRRQADDIYLTLPAVMIPASGPSQPGSRASGKSKKSGSPGSKVGESSAPSRGVQDSIRRDHEETIEESFVGLASDEPSDSVDLTIATATVWEAIGEYGKKRTSRPKIEKAISAALKRRPKGVTEADHLKRMFGGLRAYLASDEARKDGGQFEKGTHRIFEGDVWEVWLGDAPRPVGAPPVDPELGTMEAPGLKRQRLWMELDRQGMTWDSERGPRPGLLGCRVSPELQREFGYEPAAAPAASTFEVL